jgi:hypothetical protein
MQKEPNSMDNPKIATWNIMGVGDSYIFKGKYCTLTHILGNAFKYKIQDTTTTGFMTFQYYTTTPSFKSKNKFGRFKTN